MLLRCDSTRDIYPVMHPSPIPRAFLVSQHTWHQCLGHPGGDVLRRLVSNNVISCNNEKPPILCHACQVGKHVRLLFVSSNTVVTSCFNIIHLNVCTSPILGLSGFNYYVLFLDHYSQFVWVYPFLNKSDVWSKFVLFRSYVRTQFKCEIRSFQCDHDGEFDNRNLYKLFAKNDGMLSHYKARLVVNYSTQLEGVDVDDTFSSVVKLGIIWTVLSLAASRHWLIHQLDVMNAFLHGDLSETRSPMGSSRPLKLGFSILRLLSRVLAFSIVGIIRSLHQEFAMTDLGPLNYFLGIFVTRDSSGLFLSQKKYVVEILDRVHMVNCNPSQTLIDTESKLESDGDPVFDPTLYRSLAGSLQYLTFTRPDIAYAVQHVCLYMHDPREPYFSALKRILRYVRGTLDYGLHLFYSSTTDLVAYSNADWASFPTTRRSTYRYCVFLGNNLLS
nr:ribonuclease H-like domain-containing protein [Tanacetum cinerariifolium]